MSIRLRLIIFWALMFICPFAMGYMHHRFGMAGVLPMCAFALLMGLSYYPHVLGEK